MNMNKKNREFESRGMQIIVRNCPTNLAGFKDYGWDEEQIVEIAVKHIVYHTILNKVRAENLTEIDFFVPEGRKKTEKTVIKLKDLNPEQIKILKELGVIT